MFWFYALLSLSACDGRDVARQSQVVASIARTSLTAASGGSAGAAPITEASLSTAASDSLVPRDGFLWGALYETRKAADIEVCWARSALYSRTVDGDRLPVSPGALQIRRWIREAVEFSWQRYTNIYFYQRYFNGAWQDCTDENSPTRIELAFGDRNFADRGSSDKQPTRVLFDASMTTQQQVQSAAFVLFGRALQLYEGDVSKSVTPKHVDIVSAQLMYGIKPPGTLVSARGTCAYDTMESSTFGHLLPSTCFGEAPNHVWRPSRPAGSTVAAPGVALMNYDSGNCISGFPAPRELITTGPCSQATNISFANQKWKAIGELCVAATSAAEGAMLKLDLCDSNPALSRWNFDFLGAEGITLAGTSCLSVAPGTTERGAELALVGCGSINDPAGLSLPGRVRFKNDYCAAVQDNVAEPGKSIVLKDCTSAELGLAFHVSGRLTSNGQCAAFGLTPPTFSTFAFLESTACSDVGAPTTELSPDPFEWDYYW